MSCSFLMLWFRYQFTLFILCSWIKLVLILYTVPTCYHISMNKRRYYSVVLTLKATKACICVYSVFWGIWYPACSVFLWQRLFLWQRGGVEWVLRKAAQGRCGFQFNLLRWWEKIEDFITLLSGRGNYVPHQIRCDWRICTLILRACCILHQALFRFRN